MDFERVLKELLTEFERQQIRYAVIGGFALTMLGYTRATMDLDFIVHGEDLDKLHSLLSSLGYLRYAQTPHVTHYRHPDAGWGILDFIHALRKPSLAMLERARAIPFLDGVPPIKVAQPEDVIGFKVQAIANNPNRKLRELADVEQLIEHCQEPLDWPRIQEHFELFEFGEEGRQLRKRFEHAD